MAPAPWDAVPPENTLFVLVTGANSGIGLGFCQRLIDEFFASRSPSSHLVLIPTTRSSTKSAETITSLQKYLKNAAKTSKALKSRNPQEAISRVHILSVQLDLCNLPTIYKAANQLLYGTISSPADDGDFEALHDIKIPRLDVVIFNAGIGGWTGLDWPRLAYNFVTKGWRQATTFPIFKMGTGGYLVNPVPSKATEDPPTLGQVFCANIFGHYIFAHELIPLLSRQASSNIPPGRLIWESSIEACWDHLSLSDFQALGTTAAYESTKRLTDVLALTTDLPGVRPYSDAFFQNHKSDAQPIKPRTYVSHPGVVVTTIFPINFILFHLYKLAMYISRWIGSPWHPVTAYLGAVSMVWLTLASQEALDAQHAERIKWGSATDRLGRSYVKKTEVEGWGWEGKVEDEDALANDEATGVLRKMVGRKSGAKYLTEERRQEFEAVGAECWKEMERLRSEWEARAGVGGGAARNGKAH